MKENLVSASQKAYQQIRDDIFSGVLSQGHPVVEERYSELLNISRTPVREAIRRIEAEGLIKTIPRKGSYVRSFEKNEIRELYELSESIDGMAAFLVTQNASDEEKNTLRESCESMQKSFEIEDTKEWLKADSDFHRYLREFSKNKQLIDISTRLNEQIMLIRFFTMEHAVVDKKKSTRDHEEVCRAILEGDANKARELMQNHLRRIRETIMKYIF